MEWRWGFGVIEYTFIAPRPFSHSVAQTVVGTTGNNIRIEPRGDVPVRPVLRHTMAAAADALTYSIDDVPFSACAIRPGLSCRRGWSRPSTLPTAR